MLYVLLLALVLGVVLYLFRAGTFAQRPKKLTRSQENAQLIKVLLELMCRWVSPQDRFRDPTGTVVYGTGVIVPQPPATG